MVVLYIYIMYIHICMYVVSYVKIIGLCDLILLFETRPIVVRQNNLSRARAVPL